MPDEQIPELRPVVVYQRDAVLEASHVAAALGVGVKTVERMDLPYFLAGARQRFIWGQVLDVLAQRANPNTLRKVG